MIYVLSKNVTIVHLKIIIFQPLKLAVFCIGVLSQWVISSGRPLAGQILESGVTSRALLSVQLAGRSRMNSFPA